jgi:hypothetical protein
MGPIRGWSVAGVAAGLVVVLACAAPASAAVNTYTVTGFTDVGGSCVSDVCPSLRVALQAAASNPGSTVQLDAGTYALSSGQLQVIASSGSGYAVTIEGAGPTQTIIEQTDGTHRVLLLDGGPYLLKDLEVTGGNLTDATSGGEDLGGGIYANGGLSLDHVAVVGNTVTAGPGAAGSSSTPGGNAFGGGLAETAADAVSIVDSTIAGNRVIGGRGGDGGLSHSGTAGGTALGAGMSLEGSATIVGSTITANTATGGEGGGSISLSPAHGGSAFGGGVLFTGTLDMVNSTVTQNAAIGGAAGIQTLGSSTSFAGDSNGGGIDTFAGTDDILLLYSDTLDGNSAGEAGNLYSGAETGTIVLNNTALADGLASGGSAGASDNCEIDNSAPGLTIDDLGANFESDPAPSSGMSACDLSSAHHDLFDSSAKLAALADNGGPTQTMFPQAGSPLLRAGGTCLDPSHTPAVPLTTDQRGEPRGSTCDIGAVQVQGAAAAGQPTLTGNAAVGQTLSCSPSGAFTGEDLAYAYAWLRNGTTIGGQTGTSYQLAAADGGTTVSCQVTATGIAGPAAVASASVAVPAAAAPTPVAPTPVAPTPVAPGPATPAARTPGAIGLLSKRLIAGEKRVSVGLRCAGGSGGCEGTLRISVTKKHRFVLIATTSYKLASGASRKLSVRLSATGVRLLAAHPRSFAARLWLTPTGATLSKTANVTISRASHRRRKR